MPRRVILFLTFFVIGMLILGVGCGPKQITNVNLVWPAKPELPRIRYIRSISGKSDLKKGRFDRLKETLAGEESLERIIKPYGVAVDDRGRIFVSDAGNKCVLVFNENPRKDEKVLSYLGLSGDGYLQEPAGVALDDAGNIYVGDVKGNTVYSYNPDLSFKKMIGDSKTFVRPGGISFNPVTRELVVVDAKAHNVKFFDEEGNLVRTIGEKGTGEGQFNIPSNVVCGKDGKIYIVDSMNFRVQIFDKEGNFLSTFGQADNVPGSFTRPKGIALDSEGHVYVVDAAFDNVQIFDPDGTLLLYFGSGGTEPGQFQLPTGICFDKNDRLYVVDQYNHRIQIFQFISYDS